MFSRWKDIFRDDGETTHVRSIVLWLVKIRRQITRRRSHRIKANSSQ